MEDEITMKLPDLVAIICVLENIFFCFNTVKKQVQILRDTILNVGMVSLMKWTQHDGFLQIQLL